MRLRQESDRRKQKCRAREQEKWESGRAQRKRDGYAFVAMDRYLYHSQRALRLERYVTAFYGCRTSWPRIEAHAIYAVVSEGEKP